MRFKNVVVIVDAWQNWPDEDVRSHALIEKEAHTFGNYINTMLPYIRNISEVFHYTGYSEYKKHGLMKSIDRKNDKVIYKLGDIIDDDRYIHHWTNNVNRIYVCGFHYDICVNNVLEKYEKKWNVPKEKLGVLLNMTITHPCGTYKFSQPDYDHYMFTIRGSFEKIKEFKL